MHVSISRRRGRRRPRWLDTVERDAATENTDLIIPLKKKKNFKNTFEFRQGQNVHHDGRTRRL
jgi:hypothetical protein